MSVNSHTAHSAKEFRRQYTVLEEIGRGGFGIVYRAIRISDGLPVAVKFVEHKHVREWTLTCNQLIPSEVCHLETCADVPGVIRLIDWFANSKGFLIVMERPENCMDIFDLISTYGKLDEGPDENLIVNMTNGEVKLVDFGATASAEKAMKKEFQDRDRSLVTDAKIVPYETVAPQHRPLICTLKIAPPRLKQVERCGAAR
ncbi:unnamed protein product, partial [Heligmosomoides polygyrus]|uniref:non-specific serine/threonine protein kinase n=1 Tax=Heligmosomoides polygyrus TaxID=6339 RepID=A0A183F8B2_HELPZ